MGGPVTDFTLGSRSQCKNSQFSLTGECSLYYRSVFAVIMKPVM